MDESEFGVNLPWPPEDEDMVLPSPTSVPWNIQDTACPSSALTPADLDWSLFPDFRPIQMPTSESCHRDYEAPHAHQPGGVCEAQQSANHGANSLDVFAEFTWGDGLQAIEDFGWPVSKSPRESEHSLQDTTTASQDAHNNDAAAKPVEHDFIMEDAPEITISAKFHPEKNLSRNRLNVSTTARDIMEDVVEIDTGNTSRVASDSGLREEKTSELEPRVDDEYDRMDVGDKPESPGGQHMDLALRLSTSSTEDRLAQQRPTEIVHEHEQEGSSDKIEKLVESIDGDSGAGPQTRVGAERFNQLREDVSAVSLVGEAQDEMEGSMEDELEDDRSGVQQGVSSMSGAVRDMTSAHMPLAVSQESAPEHTEIEEDVHLTAQEARDSHAAPSPHEGNNIPNSQPSHGPTVSSSAVANEQEDDPEEAIQEDQHTTTGSPAPKMQIVFIPQVTDATDTGEEHDDTEAPLSASTNANLATNTRSEKSDVSSSSSDRDAPAMKKLKTSHGDQAEVKPRKKDEASAAVSPGAVPKHRTSLKSSKESGRGVQDPSDGTPGMEHDKKLLPQTQGQSAAIDHSEGESEEEGFVTPIDPQRGAEKFEVPASVENDYDMHERLSDVHSSPAKPSPRPRHPVSNWEIVSLSSNLTPNMHIAHGGRATRARKSAVTLSSGYYDEEEVGEDEIEKQEPTSAPSKKNRSSTANKNSLPVAKKARTQQPRQRPEIGIKSEQRRREVSDADEDDGGDQDYTPDTQQTSKTKKKGSAKIDAAKPASSPQVVPEPAAKGKDISSQASTKSKSKSKSKSKKNIITTPIDEDNNTISVAEPAPTSEAAHKDDEDADLEHHTTPVIPADNEDNEDFYSIPTSTPTPAPLPTLAPAKKSALRKLLPKPAPNPPATAAPATPPTLDEAKRNKFGFKPSPIKTRSRAAKGKDAAATDGDANATLATTEKTETKGKSKVKTTPKDTATPKDAASKGNSSVKGKAKASTPAEEPPKTRSVAKKERRSLRSAGSV